MNKKEILIIVLAVILAFFTGLYIVKHTNSIKQDLPPLEENVSTNNDTSAEAKKRDIEQEKVDEQKEEKNLSEVKKIKSPKTTISSQDVQKLINVEPASPKEENTSLNVMDIVKDSVSNDIVITREYKVKSPAKYSFK